MARQKITPQNLMWMAGYGARSKPAEGTLHDLWAKALAVEDAAGQRAVLVTLDLVGIDRELSSAVAAKVEKRFGIARAQLALCCSHTHSGPVVGRNLRSLHYDLLEPTQQELIRQYTVWLESELVELVARALADLQPCRLGWRESLASLAVNRRNNPEAEVPRLRAAGELRGPVDHDVPVLAVRRPGGELMAVVFGYACHATVLSGYQWTGDYPGYAQLELEKRHPGCTALFWQGCGGDQNPLPRRNVELVEHYGGELADAVDAALRGPESSLSSKLTVTYREVDLPLGKLPTSDDLRRDAESGDKYIASRAKRLLDDLGAGKPLSQTYPYPVQVWRMGDDVRWVLLGGEVVVDYSLRLKRLLGSGTWVAGYANDVMAYIPSRRVLGEGGYEGGGAMVYYGLPTVWSQDVEETIVGAVKALAGERQAPDRSGG